MEAWSILLAVVAVLLSLYYYVARETQYFVKYGIPYVKPLPVFGSLWRALFRLENITDATVRLYNVNKDAKYVGSFEFRTPMIVIRDPELIKSVTVKNFDHFPDHRGFIDESVDPLFGKNLFSLRGDRWREVRAVMSPAFTSSKMKAMFKLMSDCGKDFGEYLVARPDNERVFDTKDAFTRYTNDVIATCVFGVKVDSMRGRDNLFYVYGREATLFSNSMMLKFFIARSLPLVTKIFKLSLIRRKIADFFKDLVATTIRTRDEQGITRPDVLQLMMESRGKMGEGKELTIEDMTAQAFIFFFGGFESTSNLMCFAAHEIGVNPDVQERLQDEIDRVLEDTNGQLTYEALNNMPYLDAVINEALRMYPVIVGVDRLCVKPFELPPALPGLKPYVVKEGQYIWLPIYPIQRDPQYYEDPDTFNPDRHLDDPKKIHNSPTFISFGMGPRMCIGNRFALLETKVLLFHILARCQLKICSKTCHPMKISKKVMNMTPENGFWLRIEPRTNCHPSLDTPETQSSS